MPTKDFTSKDGARKYVRGGRVHINHTPRREWSMYKAGDRCWIFLTVSFFPLQATRRKIEEEFSELEN